ncbi:winged helix-turn-helix transcriptional regulator [Qipengyuania sp.]|uniref:winged helix-turn-helix transcriptional regulator n=1 Tax=Qipengyuania sp. TaxID=2004515 RepID=UPI0035136902
MPRLSSPRSGCPIANTLEIVGDRWSLVILRDMVNGKRRYSDFLASPEGITTNVLADRLAMLERQGIIASEPYQRRPQRFEYGLTEKGWGLLPVLQEICRWGNRFIDGTWVAPDAFMRRKPGVSDEER